MHHINVPSESNREGFKYSYFQSKHQNMKFFSLFKYIITYNESVKFSFKSNWPPVKLYPSDSPVEVEMNHPRNINQDKGRWSGLKKMKKRPAISISQDAPSESNLRVRVRNSFLKLQSPVSSIIITSSTGFDQRRIFKYYQNWAGRSQVARIAYCLKLTLNNWTILCLFFKTKKYIFWPLV